MNYNDNNNNNVRIHNAEPNRSDAEHGERLDAGETTVERIEERGRLRKGGLIRERCRM